MRGYFISFEGGEGAGKSTHIKLLGQKLAELGRDVVVTREPGGTPQGEKLRNILVTGDVDAWSAEAEALLNYAARDSHLRSLIRPALARGATVLCDRFMDSTRAYQAYAGGADPGFIDALENNVVGTTRPDLTLIFDLDPVLGLARAAARGGGREDRFERKGMKFHQALRQGFLALAADDPLRCRVLDASLPVDVVGAQLWAQVRDVLHV
jgi:dTMP kinase